MPDRQTFPFIFLARCIQRSQPFGMLPERQTLPHGIPPWVKDGSEYFITICCQPRGRNQLCNDAVAELMRESLQFRQARGDLWVHLLVLMPDHLHAIMSFSPTVGMKRSISQWKRYIACNSDVSWQRDFFDHRLRQHESYVEKAHYIRMNPVRAGLVAAAAEWKYVWEG
jgi:REP element-mobilizing transposase RayT